jgi:hypothetical protein
VKNLEGKSPSDDNKLVGTVLVGGKRFKGDCLVDFDDGNRLWVKPAELRMIEQSKAWARPGRLSAIGVHSTVHRLCVALVHGRAERLTAQNGAFRQGPRPSTREEIRAINRRKAYERKASRRGPQTRLSTGLSTYL